MNIPIVFSCNDDRIQDVDIPDQKAADVTDAIVAVLRAAELTFLQSIAVLEASKSAVGQLRISGNQAREEK